MRLLPILCCSFLLVVAGYAGRAQSSDAEKVSALKAVMSLHSNDTSKVLLLNELSFLMSRTDPKEAAAYADSAVVLASRLNHYRGLAYALDNFALCYNMVGDTAQARVAATECMAHATAISDTFLQVMALTRLGYIAFSAHRHKEIPRAYAQQALALAQASGNKRALAFAYMHVGFVQDERREYATAVHADSMAMQLFEELHEDYYRAGALHNLALEYGLASNPTAKLHTDSSALQLLAPFGETEYYGIGLGIMNTTLYEQARYGEALTYGKEALRIDLKIGNKETIAGDYLDLAMTCKKLKQYPEAATYIQQCIDIEKEVGDSFDVWLCRRVQRRIEKHL